MIPYGRQNISADDKEAVLSVLRSDFLTQGPKVKEFEEAIAKYCGARYAVAVSSGTAALHVAYLAAGFSEGDEVITTPNTFVATSNMLLAVGAKPVFCDINLMTYNIDEAKIEGLITPHTKAIVPVDFSGSPCVYAKLLELAKKHNLTLIEDACHAFGAEYEGKKIGGIADMTAFSFHPVKPITTAEGGVVVTNNEDLYRRLLLFRSHGVTKDEKGNNVMTELGYNYRLPDVLAALGLSQLSRLDSFITKRREVAQWYQEALTDLNDIELPLESRESGWHIYVIRTKNPQDREPLRRFLLEKEIGVNFHYPAVYKHPYYREHGYENVSCPNMDIYHDTCITLPCHTHLERTDIEHIANSIREYFTL